MHSKHLIAAMLVATSSSVAYAQNEQVAITPMPEWVGDTPLLDVPDDAQGALFIRNQTSIARLTAEGQRSLITQRIKLLQPQALELGNLTLNWNPAAGAAEVHAVKIHRGARIIDVLENTSFEILRREDRLEASMIDGVLTAIMQVPDLRVGDELELAFSVPGHDPVLTETSHGALAIAPSPQAGRFAMELQWEDGQKPFIQMTPDLESVARTGKNSVRISYDNPEIVRPPNDAPPRYAWSRILEYSDFADWPAVSSRFAQLFDDARSLEADSLLREEAANIAADHSSDLAKAQAALDLVQQQVRYIYVGLDGGNYRPTSADSTWKRRYGDCKGKTAMLLALLDQLGIEAEPVLVNNTALLDGLDQRLPNPGLFDHVLVRAKIDGQHYWLDGTLPEAIDGLRKPFFAYDWVLPLTSEGARPEKLVFEPFALPQEMGIAEIDVRKGLGSTAPYKYTTVKRGPAGLQEYNVFNAASPNQLEDALRTNFLQSGWTSVDQVDWKFDRRTMASVLTVSGVAPTEWEGNDYEDTYMVLPGGGFSPPSVRKRTGSGDTEIPYYQEPTYTCYVTTVRLPEETELDHWDFNSTFDTMLFGQVYYRMMEKRDDGVFRMVRGSRTETPEIASAKAERDNGRIDDFDNSKAILSYEAGVSHDAWGDLSPVPAAWEIDWTGSDVPCLPKDIIE